MNNFDKLNESTKNFLTKELLEHDYFYTYDGVDEEFSKIFEELSLYDFTKEEYNKYFKNNKILAKNMINILESNLENLDSKFFKSDYDYEVFKYLNNIDDIKKIYELGDWYFIRKMDFLRTIIENKNFEVKDLMFLFDEFKINSDNIKNMSHIDIEYNLITPLFKREDFNKETIQYLSPNIIDIIKKHNSDNEFLETFVFKNKISNNHLEELIELGIKNNFDLVFNNKLRLYLPEDEYVLGQLPLDTYKIIYDNEVISPQPNANNLFSLLCINPNLDVTKYIVSKLNPSGFLIDESLIKDFLCKNINFILDDKIIINKDIDLMRFSREYSLDNIIKSNDEDLMEFIKFYNMFKLKKEELNDNFKTMFKDKNFIERIDIAEKDCIETNNHYFLEMLEKFKSDNMISITSNNNKKRKLF